MVLGVAPFRRGSCPTTLYESSILLKVRYAVANSRKGSLVTLRIV